MGAKLLLVGLLIISIIINECNATTDGYVGQIRVFPFSRAVPKHIQCEGQILPLQQNTALFSLLGTYYGGDGKSNFALPNLQGRTPLLAGVFPPSGTNFFIGETGGEIATTLNQNEIPGSSTSFTIEALNLSSPTCTGPVTGYSFVSSNDLCAAETTTSSQLNMKISGGGGQAHNNMMPFMVLSFQIAINGVFPPRSRSEAKRTSKRNAYSTQNAISMYAFNFIPAGQEALDGQFSDDFEGGEIEKPNLPGRAIRGISGSGQTLYEVGGVMEVTLSPNQAPPKYSRSSIKGTTDVGPFLCDDSIHSAVLRPTCSGDTKVPLYSITSSEGASLPHNNMQPYLAINFALQAATPPDGSIGYDHFIGEMRLFAVNRLPTGWTNCYGQLLAINQNQALFSLIGTTFGGNGQTTFALPDMRGRIAIGAGMEPNSGAYFNVGQTGGTEYETITQNTMPIITKEQTINKIFGR